MVMLDFIFIFILFYVMLHILKKGQFSNSAEDNILTVALYPLKISGIILW